MEEPAYHIAVTRGADGLGPVEFWELNDAMTDYSSRISCRR